jgi:type II secretory pathway component GspD/PulD (secretin)
MVKQLRVLTLTVLLTAFGRQLPYAQEQGSPVPTHDTQVAPLERPASGPHPDTAVLVTNVFLDTDIRDALRTISTQTGVPIITDATVAGYTSVELDRVPLPEVLRRILTPNGLAFRWTGDYYIVGSPRPDNVAFPLLSVTELYRPNFVKASDVANLMSEYYKPFLRVSSETNTVGLVGSPELIAHMRADLARIDRAPRQVMIDALITEASTDVSRQLGIAWHVEGSKDSDQKTFSVDAFPPEAAGADSTFGAFFQRMGIMGKGWVAQYRLRLNAFAKEGKAHIRANPRVATVEGNKAQIFIGREEYFQFVSGQVTYAYAQLQVIKTGISLSIVPYVSDDGTITLEVEPSLSDVVGTGTAGLPVTSRRTVTTRVRVPDGETLVIGGLTLENRTNVIRKVPVLGSIPILGYLFRHTETRSETSEITIVITPHLL